MNFKRVTEPRNVLDMIKHDKWVEITISEWRTTTTVFLGETEIKTLFDMIQ